ncbi:hypothetical protein Q9966_008867 [Columba livia]|nr:hypothetical protein Q9966_008867 [Columba livia]
MLPKTSTRKKADEDEGAKRNNTLVLKSNLLILAWRINTSPFYLENLRSKHDSYQPACDMKDIRHLQPCTSQDSTDHGL